jgi:hypothetical protein
VGKGPDGVQARLTEGVIFPPFPFCPPDGKSAGLCQYATPPVRLVTQTRMGVSESGRGLPGAPDKLYEEKRLHVLKIVENHAWHPKEKKSGRGPAGASRQGRAGTR